MPVSRSRPILPGFPQAPARRGSPGCPIPRPARRGGSSEGVWAVSCRLGPSGLLRVIGLWVRPGRTTYGFLEREVAMTREERYAAAEQIKDAGDLAGAVAAMESLVADEPDYALAYSALAAWCTRLERHEQAVRHARKACELEPRDPFSYTALSVACMRAGLIPEAEEALAKSRMLQG